LTKHKKYGNIITSKGRPSKGRPSKGRPSKGRPSKGRPSKGRFLLLKHNIKTSLSFLKF
jgi:hypothetical protein